MEDVLDDFLYIWMGVRGGRCVSKADGKIIGADEQDIWGDGNETCLPRADERIVLLTDTINRSDLFNTLYSFFSLDLHQDTNALICRVKVLR